MTSIVFCNELTQKVSGLGISECVYYRDALFSSVYTAADAVSSTVPHVKWSGKAFAYRQKLNRNMPRWAANIISMRGRITKLS